MIFVQGDLIIEGEQDLAFTGCIMATGSITLQRSGGNQSRLCINQYTNPITNEKYPALVAINGNINSTETGSNSLFRVYGLIYAGGSIIFEGNHEEFMVDGSLIANGRISVNVGAQGSISITYNPPVFAGVETHIIPLSVESYIT